MTTIQTSNGKCSNGCRRPITFVTSDGCEGELTGMCGYCWRNPNDCTRRRVSEVDNPEFIIN